MPEKSLHFQEWLERFNRLVDQSIAELRGIKVKARRVREKKAKVKWYSFPTQVIRRDIVQGLGELYDIAVAFDRSSSTSSNTSSPKPARSASATQTGPTMTASGHSPSQSSPQNRPHRRPADP